MIVPDCVGGHTGLRGAKEKRAVCLPGDSPLTRINRTRRDNYQTGWFIGSGTEYALGWLPGLFWKNEYRWAEYDSRLTTVNCTAASLCGVAGPTAFAECNRPSVQTVRSELVFRFNWGGAPVTARY